MYIPFMSVKTLEMSCAEAADVMAPHARDLKPEDLLLAYDRYLQNFNLS